MSAKKVDGLRAQERVKREQLEGDLVAHRIRQLHLKPIQGAFDVAHLKAVHAHIFQDLPHHQPGVTRGDTPERWIKYRTLEGLPGAYDIPYLNRDVEKQLAASLDQFGGAAPLKGLTTQGVAGLLAGLYGSLDHAHGFYDGNSRTLREFMRELAAASGFTLAWARTTVTALERNQLYVARDLAVLERAYPGLTRETAMQSNERVELEAAVVIDFLRKQAGRQTLAVMIESGLTSALPEAGPNAP